MFDYRLNEIQYCPPQQEMTWFEPEENKRIHKYSNFNHIMVLGAGNPDDHKELIGRCVRYDGNDNYEGWLMLSV